MRSRRISIEPSFRGSGARDAVEDDRDTISARFQRFGDGERRMAAGEGEAAEQVGGGDRIDAQLIAVGLEHRGQRACRVSAPLRSLLAREPSGTFDIPTAVMICQM